MLELSVCHYYMVVTIDHFEFDVQAQVALLFVLTLLSPQV